MKKQNMIFGLLFLVLAAQINAQDTSVTSPLLDSWKQYLRLKQESTFGLEWISLGPVLNSARVEAVQVDETRPGTMYAAFGSGNLWKTVNNGLTWKPIFENQSALGIGDIALAPSNPDIIWLGSGESLKKPRNFTMPGTGIFRSDDGGETWRNTGLLDSYHIGEVAVHPENPEIVFAAVQGHFWSTNKNRGLYRTVDGGNTWEHVLFINELVGANDVVISPSNPEIVYASMWENNPGQSGPESGVYRSSDGGKTWARLKGGLPDGPKTGRIGLAVSWTNPDKVYALIDNLNKKNKMYGEVYRTLDGGKSWKRTHEEELQIFSRIGWYFTDCYVNPQNDEEIFGLGVRMAHSTNGGKMFSMVGGDIKHFNPNPATVLHLDHCELWINPRNPDHLALGNDGGLYVSYDKGGSWMHYNNIPAGEFYDISVDTKEPYNVYGGTQDDASVYGPAREWNPKAKDGWEYVWIDPWAGGDGCYTMADPTNDDIIYSSSQNGGIFRQNMRNGQRKGIRPRLPKKEKGELLYNFIAPYFISKYDPQTLYHAGNFVFKSINRGDQWELISPDLSLSAIKEKRSIAAGAIAESPLQQGLLYVGTDRGAFWMSEDDGRTWIERSAGLPDAYIRCICPSRFDKSVIYLAASGINYDDLGNHLYISEDAGMSWRSISANLPDEVAYTVLEDPVHEQILYSGLYRGVYISLDRGLSWSLLGPKMAATAISDLVIQEREMDLIAGTHGRGVYKMNIRPIQQAFEEGMPQTDRLFTIPEGCVTRAGAVEKLPITFYLKDGGTVEIRLIDKKGKRVWTTPFQGRKGLNQYRWDLVVKRVTSPEPYFTRFVTYIKPGTYEIQVAGNGIMLKQECKIGKRDQN